MNNIFQSIKNNLLSSEDILYSSKPASVVTFVIVAIIFTSLLSIRYYLFQNIIVNGIAQKTIYAKNSFEVIDRQKTESIKREVANKIRPVVAPVEREYIEADLQKLIEGINKVKHDKQLSYHDKQKKLADIIEVNDSQRENKAIAYILSQNDTNLSSAYINTKYALNTLLSDGIYDLDLSNILTDNYLDKIYKTHLKRAQYPLIISFIEQSVTPNLMVDEYATEIARKNARNAVKPYVVAFKKGDVILQDGEKATQLQKDALKVSGYNAFELNQTGIAGIFVLVCMVMYCLILYIKRYEKQYYVPRYLFYIALSSIILVYSCILISDSYYISNYMMPFIAFSILLAIFTNPIFSFLTSVMILALLSFSLFLDAQLFFVFVFAILISCYIVAKMSYSKRFDIIWCGFRVGSFLFCTMLCSLLFEEQGTALSILFGANLQNPFLGFLNGIISSMIAMFFIPIIEKVCKIVSPYALIELADQNQELMSKLRSSAPGTFHHSLMVANLCEEAAAAIGANSILARVGAYYHDIGKLQRPLFFIENQSYFGVENPHTTLTPRQSKMVITLHTKDGVEIAKKYGLPQVIIDFIQQHHGESLAGYFYNKALEQEGSETVSESQFRYPGPKPQTKETAILMLADAIESSVRAMKNPTQEEIENTINKIFTERLNDGQLSDSPLTLKDIKIIAMTFNKVLRGMQHERIKYQENTINEISNRIAPLNAQDDEFEKKLKELQSKSQKEDEI